jgi:sRNA-binding carbon storage regulator CsrA
MLVLNRRPGEAIVIDPDLRVTVLSVTDRRVWIAMESASAFPELRVSASVVSPNEARLEIAPMSSVTFDTDRVRITAAAKDHAANAARAGLAIDRKPGERVEVGDDLWVAVTSISKGNPTIAFGGSAIGEEFSITLIRPAGSYVRLGVDAPNRRVYREELWDVVQASGGTRDGDGHAGHPGPSAQVTASVPPVLEPPAPPTLPEPATITGPATITEPATITGPATMTVPADVTAGSAAG